MKQVDKNKQFFSGFKNLRIKNKHYEILNSLKKTFGTHFAYSIKKMHSNEKRKRKGINKTR